MRAVVHTSYGSPDVLRLAEVEQPTPKDDEVLIQIRAATVNRTDCGFRKPEPFFVRLFSGLLRPKQQILGTEFSGQIVEAGAMVTEFAVGDAVFGVRANEFGTHAEYVCMPESGPLAPKPVNMTFEQAAAVCDGATLALTYLRRAKVGKGQRILIYGASGSIGTAAVQLAKHFGADVTAVCNTENVETVRSLRPDRVIDYTEHDFTADEDTYDVVFDAVGKTSFARCKDTLKPGGIFTATDLGPLSQNPLLALVTRYIGDKKVLFPVPHYTKECVVFLKELVEAGEYRAVIDRRYDLDDIVEATRYVEAGQKTGNVVLTVSDV